MMETFSKDKVLLPNCTSQREQKDFFFIFLSGTLTIKGQISDFLTEFCLY